jgi:hypothetical protein
MASLIVSIAPHADLVSVRLSSNADGSIDDGFGYVSSLGRLRPNVVSLSLGLETEWKDRLHGYLGQLSYRLNTISVQHAAKDAVIVMSGGNLRYEKNPDGTDARDAAGKRIPRPDVVNVYALLSRFAGMLAVGGVYKLGNTYHASDAASGYPWKDGQEGGVVPTVCAICGPADRVDYIWRPVPSAEGRTGTWKKYNSASSGAAAQVAGLCALVLEAFPNASPDQVKKILVDSAQEIDPANGRSAQGSRGRDATGAGVVQIEAAIVAARKAAAVAAAAAAVPTGHGGNVMQVVANGS